MSEDPKPEAARAPKIDFYGIPDRSAQAGERVIKAPPPSDDALQELVFYPSEFAELGLEEIDENSKDGTRALDINIPKVRDYFAPTRPGTTCGIIGQTSMGKSLLLHYIEYRAALQISTEKRPGFILHVSHEEPIEDMASLAIARHSGQSLGDLFRGKVADRAGLANASVIIGTTPIVYVGESIRRSQSRKAAISPDILTLRNIGILAESVKQALGLPLVMAGFDYLQAFPIDMEAAKAEMADQRRLQVRQDVYGLRRFGHAFGCTNWVAIQAKQDLRGIRYDRAQPSPMMPGVYDGEETSSIGQRFDRLLSVWIPYKSFPLGTAIQMGPDPDSVLMVEESQMLVKVTKQRGGLPSGRTFLLHPNYDTGDFQIGDYSG